MAEPTIDGHLDARFERVREPLLDNLRSGAETGVSLAVDIDGETVVDVHGGFADEARTRPWTSDTIVNAWSNTKTVTNLAALILVDRGLLDIDAPVAKYWPEFAASGKDGVLVRHVLSHTSGVPGWESPFTQEDMYDWEKATSVLAGQAPWWEPGTASGYHASNQGHLVGEIVRRITGMPLKRFVAEEIAGPLDADFHIGAPQSTWGRCAEIIPPPPVDLPLDAPDSILARTAATATTDASAANTPAWRRADMGAINGHGNAASLARIMSAVTLGGMSHGVRLLSPATIELIFQEQADGVDMFLGVPIRWGVGYALPSPGAVPYVPHGKVCFWGGWGGSMVVMDLERRMTVAYMMNRMKAGILGSDTAAAYITAIYDSL